MGETAKRAEGQPIDQALLHPRALAVDEEEMAMLPARVGPPDLNVEKAHGRIVLAHERAPAQGHAEPDQAQVEHGARRHRGRRRPQAHAQRGRHHGRHIDRIGEEREDLGAGLGEPHA